MAAIRYVDCVVAFSEDTPVRLITELLPDGKGWRVRFMAPLATFPPADAEADTARMNRFIEGEILKQPAQYLWVHKRFKTRPEGEPGYY